MTDEGTNGFLCEFNDKIIKIYTLDRGLVELPNDTEQNLVLGNWYWILDNEIESQDYFESDEIKVSIENGDVFVQICAISPNEFALPKEIRDKYSLMVWSPFLNFLNDANDIFINNFRGGDVGEIIVKYAPFEKHLFEVVKVVGMAKISSHSYVKLTPWTLEFMGKNMTEIAYPDRRSLCVNQFEMSSGYNTQIGVLIKTNIPNPSANPLNRGSAEICSILFSPQWGLTRWVPKISKEANDQDSKEEQCANAYNSNDPSLSIGKWFSYELCETRRRKDPEGKTAFRNTTARKMIEVNPTMPTRIVDGEVQIETSFVFDYEMFESDQNRTLKWKKRFKGLNTEAHFWDIQLGKIEIYPRHSRIIIEEIEKHREVLRRKEPSEYGRLKNETIIVVVQAVVHNNFLQNVSNYPKYGIFVVKSVDTICYLHRGKIIYKA